MVYQTAYTAIREGASSPRYSKKCANEVVDVPDESASGDPPYLADSALEREVQQGAGSDDVVDIPAAEGGGMFDNAHSWDRNGGESRDEPEVEEEQPIGQSQRPARVRRPPDRYGELILNSL